MECKYHHFCGLTDEFDPEAGLCILHSRQAQKDQKAFDETLAAHRKANGDQFSFMVFPGRVHFSGVTFTGASSFFRATFTEAADFVGATFTGYAGFTEATFTQRADFTGVTFTEAAEFYGVTFTEDAVFGRATFTEAADFRNATFGVSLVKAAAFGNATFNMMAVLNPIYGRPNGAYFSGVTFTGNANFSGATFTRRTNFSGVTFLGEVNFQGTRFSGTTITFQGSHFNGRVLFTGGQGDDAPEDAPEDPLIFQDATAVDFRDLVIDPPESLCFRQADFRTCRLLNTDLRKIELTGVRWPQAGARRVVHDEDLLRARVQQDLRTWKENRLRHAMPKDRCTELCTRVTGTCTLCEALAEAHLFLWGWRDAFRRYAPGTVYPWERMERLYRELKQNSEDRRDYARAADFHYGEKEMQRLNPRTPLSLKVFLWLYWMVSGYGARYLRPLLWAVGLLVVGIGAYWWWGLEFKKDGAPFQWTTVQNWCHAVDYSLRVITFLRPDDLVPKEYARHFYTLQSLLGPLFLGLFALAVRQRLKH